MAFSKNMFLLYVLNESNFYKHVYHWIELIGRYLDDQFVLSADVLWEENGARHNSNCRRTRNYLNVRTALCIKNPLEVLKVLKNI